LSYEIEEATRVYESSMNFPVASLSLPAVTETSENVSREINQVEEDEQMESRSLAQSDVDNHLALSYEIEEATRVDEAFMADPFVSSSSPTAEATSKNLTRELYMLGESNTQPLYYDEEEVEDEVIQLEDLVQMSLENNDSLEFVNRPSSFLMDREVNEDDDDVEDETISLSDLMDLGDGDDSLGYNGTHAVEDDEDAATPIMKSTLSKDTYLYPTDRAADIYNVLGATSSNALETLMINDSINGSYSLADSSTSRDLVTDSTHSDMPSSSFNPFISSSDQLPNNNFLADPFESSETEDVTLRSLNSADDVYDFSEDMIEVLKPDYHAFDQQSRNISDVSNEYNDLFENSTSIEPESPLETPFIGHRETSPFEDFIDVVSDDEFTDGEESIFNHYDIGVNLRVLAPIEEVEEPASTANSHNSFEEYLVMDEDVSRGLAHIEDTYDLDQHGDIFETSDSLRHGVIIEESGDRSKESDFAYNFAIVAEIMRECIQQNFDLDVRVYFISLNL
jgi:hypothetical protein